MSSLALPEGSGRSRSKSPGRRDRDKSPGRRDRDKSPGRRERDKSPGRPEKDVSPTRRGRDRTPVRKERERSPVHAQIIDGPDEAERGGRGHQWEVPAPEAPRGGPAFSHTANPQFEHRRGSPPLGSHPSYAQPGQYQHAQVRAEYAEQPKGYGHRPADRRASSPVRYTRPGDYPNVPPQEHPHYADPGQYQYAQTADHGDKYARGETRHLSLQTSAGFNVNTGHGHPQSPTYVQPGYGQTMSPAPLHGPQYAYAQPPGSYDARRKHGPSPGSPGREYAKPVPYQYAQPDERISYKYKGKNSSGDHGHDEREEANVIEIQPGRGPRHSHESLSAGDLGPRMNRLSVSGGVSGAGALALTHHGAPPGSPLLEAYHGTYQSISPMPSPIMGPTLDDDLSDLAPLSARSSDSEDAARRRREKKRVKFYDPEDDAKELAEALRHTRIDAEPLIEILPGLSHDQMLQLRNEYKKYARVQGKGINIAKHIKVQVGSSAFGKACYATALGKWESEAWWANFWYQTNTSRRELLIEALMGRTNAEMRAIKDAFSDKRYGDSLERCMKAELKADKFRVAVLLALEERRQEEASYVSGTAVREDVRRLHDALIARDGGETALIQIVVLRSDAHMREVLKEYERAYGKNFAKEMLRKSTNLVGETLAHILNGLINRPVRDALLLHQALTENSRELRNELLISRLVRYHWDRPHLERIKVEFRNRYRRELASEVAENTKGDFGEFCTELCVRR
ncbi:MAG: hypothetical protein M1825_003749 [Sarcosagium campestre]|nr:MAG: hypothetical protein M1825_003749 [Sarcosagium campestre]